MRKPLIILCACASILFAQQFTLEWVNPKPTGATLYDVVSLQPGDVNIYGVASTFIKSNDGLNTYTMSFIDEQRTDIWSVHFVNQDIGYACGEDGLMLKTTNGGTNWVKQTTWVTSRLYDVEFLNPDSGIAVGASGLVLITTNGGTTWNTTYYTTSTNYKISIVNRNLIYIGSAATTGRLARTTDFGTTWTPLTPSLLTSAVYSIIFFNENIGRIGTASNGILYTSDGGANWSQEFASTNIIYDIKFKDSQVGFAVDSRGFIYSTVNAGQNWSSYQVPSRKALRAIAIDGNNIYTVGDAGSIYRSTDLGINWEAKFSYIGQALEFHRRVIFFNENIGYVAGGSTTTADSLGYVLKTTDGGVTWFPLPYNFKTQLYGIATPSENVIYTCAGSSLVFKSTDGGLTWTRTVIFGTATTLWDIQFFNESLGYACGSSGRIFKTTNGGVSWTSLSNPFGTSTIYTMSILDSLNMIAVGVGARAHKTTDGGSTWITLNAGIPGSYFIVRFKGNVGYIGSFVSPSGYVSKSTDGGNTWTALTSYPGTQSVWGIDVKDDSTVYVVDLFGYVYYSTNGGNTWISTPRIFGSNSFYCSLAGDKLFISGSNGAILRGFTPTIPPETRVVNYNTGWNILSVPLISSDMRKSSLFPAAISSAFAYTDGYYSEDTLKTGKGYWLKFDSAGTVNVIGRKVSEYSINLSAGWNLFGPFDFSIQTSDVLTNPPNIIVSNFFAYNRGYQTTNLLETGKGYWVKLSQAGTLSFPSVVKRTSELPADRLEDNPHIVIKDGSGNSGTLYILRNAKNNIVELPPIPPAGIFDVRFSDNKMTEIFSKEAKLIQINSAIYPVEITLKGIDAEIIDCINGNFVNKLLKSGELLVIDNKNITALKIKPINLVYDFSLYQNYPNPFNPVTTIKFSIPEQSQVKLSLYDVLGRKVKDLMNDKLDAGIHSIHFDGSNFASGIYFYRLEAGKNVSIKKMMLIK